GLTAQAGAKAREIVFIRRELESTRGLWEKKLTSLSRLTALEREATRLDGQHAQLLTSVAATRGRVAETELQIIQIDRDLASDVGQELRDAEAKISELVERKIAAEDQLRRLDIRSPQHGIVHQSSVHTVGGVIKGGEAIMLIVPRTDKLMVEAKVAPTDIDQLMPGQAVGLRFTAFNQRTTPEIDGRLHAIAPDVSVDERSGQRYYAVRISMSAPETARLGGLTLVPGMPVEAFIRTGKRTVLSYLVKPISDHSTRAFRGD
ncbi:MAG: HlyD family type I secretion periplasmic adaptor subunit, partial [Alphaproteobacteria bacterium]|nr:HlyD family type I secretion periplasmic adaptor subunit [Alphaproteobacteria bacterium]